MPYLGPLPAASPLTPMQVLSSLVVVPSNNGGTGVNNNVASTLTISGSFGLAFTISANTSLTLPVSGTLAPLGGTNTWTGLNTFGNTVIMTNTLGSALTLDTSGSSVSIANGANAAIAIVVGLLVVHDVTTGATGLYLHEGGSITLVSGGVGEWVSTTTTPAAGKASVAWANSAARIYNNVGTTRNFTAAQIGL